jgi:hypothetical protein
MTPRSRAFSISIAFLAGAMTGFGGAITWHNLPIVQAQPLRLVSLLTLGTGCVCGSIWFLIRGLKT